MSDIDIDQLINLIHRGDKSALRQLRSMDVSLLTDEQFKKLLPYFSFSDADVEAIIKLIDEELQNKSTTN